MAVELGQVIDGKYRIVRLIGQGGMGAVYEGLNQLIDRRVAIKVMLPDIGTAAVGRFEQEARAAGRIGNDHILEILDVGRLPDSSHFMVMEFLDGESLEARLEKRGALQPAELAPIALQLLTALGAAHRAGVLHRDLKPDNVFLVREKAGHRDFVKLIDFGISKFSQDAALNLTKTGTMMGTPYYMSPEQARGKGPVDARADLYAVGVILYQAVSGQLPFVADTFNDLLFKIVLEAAPPVTIHAPFLDPRFAAIVSKAMAREANDRYQTAEELADGIATWLHESAIRLPSVAPSYRQPMSQASSRTPRGETPVPMATIAVPDGASIPTSRGPMSHGVSASYGGAPSSADPLSYGTPTGSPLGRGTTPPTPATFGRTAADALERPIPPTSGWRNPLVWAAIVLGVGATAAGAILLLPGSDPVQPPSPAVGSPAARAPAAPFHGDQFRPEALEHGTAQPEAGEPKAAQPTGTQPNGTEPKAAEKPDAAAGEPDETTPSTQASARSATKSTRRATSKPTTTPASPPPKASPPAAAQPDGKDAGNQRFYFGY